MDNAFDISNKSMVICEIKQEKYVLRERDRFGLS
jgi:hypothetical protein